MKHKQFWIGTIAGIAILILGIAIMRILPDIFAAVVPIAFVGLLYLVWRLVRAIEQIADTLEQQQTAERRSESVTENDS